MTWYLLDSLHNRFSPLLTFNELYLFFVHIRCDIRVIFRTDFNMLDAQIIYYLYNGDRELVIDKEQR